MQEPSCENCYIGRYSRDDSSRRHAELVVNLVARGKLGKEEIDAESGLDPAAACGALICITAIEQEECPKQQNPLE